MPLTKAQKQTRKARAKEWKEFRAHHLLSQADLAKTLGIAKRTVQHIEGETGEILPHVTTLQKFATLKARFEGEHAKENGQRASRRRA